MRLIVAALVLLVLSWGWEPPFEVRSAFWAALFGLIAGIFVQVAQSIVTVVSIILPFLKAVFFGLAKVIVRVGRAFGDFARTIASGVKSFVDGVLKPLAKGVAEFFRDAGDWLRRVTQPIRDVLERINNALDWVWERIIAPVLDALEKVRAVLRILAELGVPFAAQLDQILQRIEQTIFNTFREVRSFINNVFGFIDILFDPRGWIRSTPFLYTTVKWSGNIVNLMTKLGIDPRILLENEEYRAANPTTPPAAVAELFAAGGYRNHPGVTQAAAAFRTRGAGLA